MVTSNSPPSLEGGVANHVSNGHLALTLDRINHRLDGHDKNYDQVTATLTKLDTKLDQLSENMASRGKFSGGDVRNWLSTIIPVILIVGSFLGLFINNQTSPITQDIRAILSQQVQTTQSIKEFEDMDREHDKRIGELEATLKGEISKTDGISSRTDRLSEALRVNSAEISKNGAAIAEMETQDCAISDHVQSAVGSLRREMKLPPAEVPRVGRC